MERIVIQGSHAKITWRRDSIHCRPSDSKFASLSGSLGRVGGWGTSSLDPTVILGVKQSMLALLSTLYTRGNKMKCLIMAQRVWNSLYSLTSATFSWDSFWGCWGTLDDFLICGEQHSCDFSHHGVLTTWAHWWRWFDPFLLHCKLLENIYQLSISSAYHLSSPLNGQ